MADQQQGVPAPKPTPPPGRTSGAISSTTTRTAISTYKLVLL